MCKFPDGAANEDMGDLRQRIERYIDPALIYACKSWHLHLVDRYTMSADTSGITLAIRRFLETKFLFWLEVLSVLGAVGNAVDALQAAADWLEVCRDSEQWFLNLLILDQGIIHTRPCQRLFPFRDQLLRDHQRILFAYLSLSPSVDTKIIDRTAPLRGTRPTSHESCVRYTSAVGFSYLCYRISFQGQADCVVAMQ